MTDADTQERRLGGRNDSRGGLFELAALVGAGVGLGTALWWLSGPPQLPSGWPVWEQVVEVLSASNVDYESVISVVASLGWLALAYLAPAIAMRTVARALVSLSDGAGWARSAFRLSNFVTIPVVRRIVDGGLAGIVIAAIWLRGGSGSEASVVASGHNTILSVGVGPSLPDSAAELASTASVNRDTSTSGDTVISYTVVEGDNLWDISRRFYGDGTLYTEIFRANEGRIMKTGETFLNPRLIRPAWVLDVPLPAHNAWPGGNHLMYRVRPNDSLWRISENLLGEGLHWTEIWNLNQGREMEAGRHFINPSYILPGWILELPVEVTAPTANQNGQLQMPSSYPAPQPTPTGAPAATPGPDPVPTARWTVPPVEQPRQDDSGGSLWPSVPAQTVLAAAGALAAS